MSYICSIIKKRKDMETFTAQDFKMLEDLKAFAKAIKFQVTTGEDLQTLLKKWVNHRVELTPQVLDNCWNEYLTAKGF